MDGYDQGSIGKFGTVLGFDRDLDLLLLDEDLRPSLPWLLLLRLGLLPSFLSAFAFLLSLSALSAELDSLFAKRFDRTSERNAISAPSLSSFQELTVAPVAES